MSAAGDQVFRVRGEDLETLPLRTFREGIVGEEKEKALQTLLEKHPDIIPGSQLRPENPPKFVLFCHEMPIGSWSVDVVLADTEAVLTIVETKLRENRESRRQVLGQVIEYAAHASIAWGNGRARAYAQEYWGKEHRNVDEAVVRALGEDDAEKFWRRLDDNLEDGRMRVIIASDRLAPEVRVALEFLYSLRSRVEFLGLEVRCYGETGSDLVIVPRIVGRTETGASARKTEQTDWTAEALRKYWVDNLNEPLRTRMHALLEWSMEKGRFIQRRTKNPKFGIGSKERKQILSVSHEGRLYSTLVAGSFGGIERRNIFIAQLNQLPIFDLRQDDEATGRESQGAIDQLTDEEFQSLLSALEAV